MSERTRFQSQLLLQLSRLARRCSGLSRSYSSKRKGLHRPFRRRSNTCTSTTRFRKLRRTEFRALGQDSRFEPDFANSDPRLFSKTLSLWSRYNLTTSEGRISKPAQSRTSSSLRRAFLIKFL